MEGQLFRSVGRSLFTKGWVILSSTDNRIDSCGCVFVSSSMKYYGCQVDEKDDGDEREEKN